MLFKLLRKVFNRHVNLILGEALAIALFLTLLGLDWNYIIEQLLNRIGVDAPVWLN